MSKSPDAFRTISEVAEWLDTPAHVLRFWESKFTQVKPVKRAGGRRYYRPADMDLLSGIKRLLHDDGMTIKGVQKILREQGVRYVATLAEYPDGEDAPDHIEEAPFAEMAEPADVVVPFNMHQTESGPIPAAPPVSQPELPPLTSDPMADTPETEPERLPAEPTLWENMPPQDAPPDEETETADPLTPDEMEESDDMSEMAPPSPSGPNVATPAAEELTEPEPPETELSQTETLENEAEDAPIEAAELPHSAEPERESAVAPDDAPDALEPEASADSDTIDATAADLPLPAFLQNPLGSPPKESITAPSEPEQVPEVAEHVPEVVEHVDESALQKPLPDMPDLDAIEPTEGVLSLLARITALDPEQAQALEPQYERLRALQTRLCAPRGN
ncbi:MerR family transcriptional regulator [Puniceibacterium sp. IMCC21224]|uniref:MerR family transcriptional regulator n=1 Tax=Puniceibacterium sp. IMCC21224 TaxID=1618204 RepID=UPI00065D9F43|nr:MerR family transcriptional regulator [Puniceibacterium sp. IMCC21224]KMK67388.1 putative transcriptional regulator [Puniceibacterium sp. IMCC21224]